MEWLEIWGKVSCAVGDAAVVVAQVTDAAVVLAQVSDTVTELGA